MKKAINNIILAVMFVGLLSGCGEGAGTPDISQGTESSGASDVIQDVSEADSQEISVGAGGILDPSAVLNLSMKDNSLDAYSAVERAALQPEKLENEGGGMERSVLGVTGAYHFKKHVLSTAAESWDEVLFVTGEGKANSERYEVKDQLWGIGQVVGTDHYVVFSVRVQEDGEYQYFLTERDENHEYLREVPLDFLSGELDEVLAGLSDFLVDETGRVHMLWNKYMLLSQEGEILGEYSPEDGYIKKLVPLYDGRIAFEVEAEGVEGGIILQYIDEETHSPVTLATLKKDAFCFTLLDEDTLLYADREGVHRSGLSGENPEVIYCWTNHGVIAHGVSALQADEEGRITLIYSDSENHNYLSLEPTTEEVEICEITIAVPPYRMSSYRPMVVEFNKRYPRYHVELKSDYDETALLTELTAGKGPVLIDTLLTGFEEQEQQWEPLDAIMEQLGITEELLPSVLDMGRIHGALYGVVTDFRLRTLITGDSTLKDWDYDAFLQCVEGKPDLEAIFDFYGGDYGTYFITSFLSHGIDDTYLLDAETRTLNFDSSDFRRALELAKKYCVREEGVSPGTSLLEGKVLCNELTISKPEDFAAYRICYGENANYIGYPTKNGAAHFMESGSNPLAIRRTATEEEKEAAIAFISVCLSYEGQIQASRDLNYGLSVRKDVLEEQIAAMTEDTVVDTHGFGRIVLGDDLNIEQDRTALLDMVDKARPLRYFPMELMNIMSEELEQYFSDTITEELTIDHLKSRVGLYLEEGN